MYLLDGMILNKKYIIDKSINLSDNYIVYACTDFGDAKFRIYEYFPINGKRDDEGMLTINEEDIGLFEAWMTNINTDCEICQTLTANDYLKIVEVFHENGTCYVVTEEILGQTISEFIQTEEDSTVIESVFLAFAKFMEVVEELCDNAIFFRINPDTIFISNDGEFRLSYFYLNNFQEEHVIKDVLNLICLQLTGKIDERLSNGSIANLNEAQSKKSPSEQAEYNEKFKLFENKFKGVLAFLKNINLKKLTSFKLLKKEFDPILEDDVAKNNEGSKLHKIKVLIDTKYKTKIIVGLIVTIFLVSGITLSYLVTDMIAGDPFRKFHDKEIAQESLMQKKVTVNKE